jgi:hypothetical protein
MVTLMPRVSRIAAREAAAIPFPREETTPPVTNTYLVMDIHDTGKGLPEQIWHGMMLIQHPKRSLRLA